MTELKYFRKLKNEKEAISAEVFQIKTDEIRANRAQPRADFNQNSIIRLADSIRRYGILQPLTVRETDPEDSYRYELIAGERRLRAAKMLGYLTVPCIIKETDEQTAAELAIIENLLREDLNMFEEAYGYKKLIETHHLTQEEVARRMSISQSAVANKIRLLKLSFEEQKYILECNLTERHARALLRIDDQKDRIATIGYIFENKLNVQGTEEYVEELLQTKDRSVDKTAYIVSKNSPLTDSDLGIAVKGIRKKVDSWVKEGKNAEINVTSMDNYAEIHIKLFV